MATGARIVFNLCFVKVIMRDYRFGSMAEISRLKRRPFDSFMRYFWAPGGVAVVAPPMSSSRVFNSTFPLFATAQRLSFSFVFVIGFNNPFGRISCCGPIENLCLDLLQDCNFRSLQKILPRL